MRKVWMIAALALLVLSVSGCANAEYSEGTPSSEETVMVEPVQSIAPQERTTVSVSESTEIPAESTAESEIAEIPPEVSTPAAGRAPLPTESSTTESAPPKASEPPMQETEPPAAEGPAEPAFDIQTWIDYAKAYAESVGLRLESSAVDCWDNPIDAAADRIYLERDICSRLNRYAAAETITDVWVWYEAVGANSYL